MTNEIEEKPCSECGEILPANVEHFGRRSRTPDGLGKRCLECERERRRDFEKHVKQTRAALARSPSAGVSIRPLDQRAQRKIALMHSRTPSRYRGVVGGPVLFGYVRRAS